MDASRKLAGWNLECDTEEAAEAVIDTISAISEKQIDWRCGTDNALWLVAEEVAVSTSFDATKILSACNDGSWISWKENEETFWANKWDGEVTITSK